MKPYMALAFIRQLLQEDASNHTGLFPEASLDWPLFYRLLIRHRVWHHVLQKINTNGIELPAPFAKKLASFCQQDRHKILITAKETARIAKTFNHSAIPYCVIKGITLNCLIYGALNTRPCRDIDVWVDPSRYQEAIIKLTALGYQKTLPNYALHGFKERYYMTHKHDMAFYHPEQKILVELHFRLHYFGIHFYTPSANMLTTIDLFNTPITTLQDDYHLLYLMIHGSIHAWLRLRWLHDIALFIKSGRCNLEHVMQLAGTIHCEHIVKQSLLLAKAYFALDNAVLDQAIQNPSRRVIALTNLAKQFITADYLMTDGVRNIKMFFLYRYYLLRLAVKRKKVNAVFSDLFKIDALFPHITLPDKLCFLYYLLYPGWIIFFIWKSRRMRNEAP